MSYLTTILAFLFVLFVLVVFHELGHFCIARLCGVRVLRFSFGIGKVLWSKQFSPNGTEWAISLFPIGGYVKMLDKRVPEYENLTPEELKHEFTSQPPYKRMAIVAAGPLANFLLAIVLLAGLYVSGVPEIVPVLGNVPEQSIAYQSGLRGNEVVQAVDGQTIHTFRDVSRFVTQATIDKKTQVVLTVANTENETKTQDVVLKLPQKSTDEIERGYVFSLGLLPPKPEIVIGDLTVGGVADTAGLKKDDIILTVDGRKFDEPSEIAQYVKAKPDQTIEMTVLRQARTIVLPVHLGARYDQGQRVGSLQVLLGAHMKTITIQYSFLDAITNATIKTWDVCKLTVQMIGKMLSAEVSTKNITGPITIAKYAGQTAQAGIYTYLHFIVFISISMGIMNLLPIPVLDGGLLLYYAVEIVLRDKISEKYTRMVYRAGIVILVMLMALALFNDVIQLF